MSAGARPGAERPGKVWLVGAGPGDPGLLTLKGARALAQCEVLVYDYLASSAIVGLAPPDCERIYVGKKAGAHTLSQDEITALIVRLGLEGKKVVRLKGGDVFVFARGGEEAQALREAGVPFEIVPGITSAIAAPAYAGIPVSHRDHNTSFTIATGHEDPTKGYSSLDYAKLANRKATTIFLMAMGNLAGIVAELRAHGLEGDTPVGIVREGTKPTQQTVTGTIDTIVAEVARTGIGAPAIVVIGDVVREREHIRWFDAQPLFGKRVLVTRPAHQADDIALRLYEVGAEPILAPTIAIGPPDDPRRRAPTRWRACATTRGSCSQAATAWTRSSRTCASWRATDACRAATVACRAAMRARWVACWSPRSAPRRPKRSPRAASGPT